MLLVLDVGNTNTVLGVFAKAAKDDGSGSFHYDHLVANWRVATIATQTVDEYGVLFRNLFAMEKIEVKGIHGIVISSVVPPLDSTLRQVASVTFNSKPLFIEPGVKTGMPVLYDNPAEVGADRIVNSVAAFEKYRRALHGCGLWNGDYFRLRICQRRISGRRDLPGHWNFCRRAV